MPFMDNDEKWTLIRPYLTTKQWYRIDLRRQGKLLRAIAAVEGVSFQAVAQSIKGGIETANKIMDTIEKPLNLSHRLEQGNGLP